jgi:hypothetical protein
MDTNMIAQLAGEFVFVRVHWWLNPAFDKAMVDESATFSTKPAR